MCGELSFIIMKKLVFLSCFAVGLVLLSCFGEPKKRPLQKVLALYQRDVTDFASSVSELVKACESGETNRLQSAFKQSRAAYKKVEWLAVYYNPFTAKQINGPAIAEVEPSDKSVVMEPEGFQVMEEGIFPVYDALRKAELIKQAKVLRATAKRLENVASTLETTEAHLLDALRLQIFRIAALGISGFDSPIAKNSLAEAEASLQSIGENLRPFAQAVFDNEDTQKEMDGLVAKASNFLKASKSFDSFDRMGFITQGLNPLSAGIVSLQKTLKIPFFTEPRALRATASTMFDSGAFNPDFYAPDASAYSSAARILLGKKLFYDAVLSDGGKRNCASCHKPELAFTDGLKAADVLGGGSRFKRNTPTLINAGLQPFLFYDMRVGFLEDQAAEVVKNKDEMHGDFAKAIGILKKDAFYTGMFRTAYTNQDVTETQIKNALASYIRSLTKFSTPFDDYMRGNKGAMTAEQIKGFNLFMGKARCGTCHFAPLFNGVNPPEFSKVDAEIIGVPATADTLGAALDADEGKYATYKISLHRYAFKTPTLRNVALTAPYMHNGVYNTLPEVIDFYDRGGGQGLGIEVPGQTLSQKKLNLSKDEKTALLAFLKALTDR